MHIHLALSHVYEAGIFTECHRGLNAFPELIELVKGQDEISA